MALDVWGELTGHERSLTHYPWFSRLGHPVCYSRVCMRRKHSFCYPHAAYPIIYPDNQDILTQRNIETLDLIPCMMTRIKYTHNDIELLPRKPIGPKNRLQVLFMDTWITACNDADTSCPHSSLFCHFLKFPSLSH